MKSIKPPTVPAKAAYSISDLVVFLSIGRTTIFEMIKAGELRAVKCRGRTLVLASEVDRFLNNLKGMAP